MCYERNNQSDELENPRWNLCRADRALKTDYKMRKSNKRKNFENTFQAKGTAQQPEWD